MIGLDPTRHLTLDEAATALQVSRRTMWRYIAAGAIATFKHRGRTYIAHDQIEDYFTRQQQAGDVKRARKTKRAK